MNRITCTVLFVLLTATYCGCQAAKTQERRDSAITRGATAATTQRAETTGGSEIHEARRQQTSATTQESAAQTEVRIEPAGAIVVSVSRRGAASTQPAVIESARTASTQPSTVSVATSEHADPVTERTASASTSEPAPVDWGWIYPVAAIVLFVFAGVATFYFPKSPTLGGVLAAVAAACMAAKYLSVIFAVVIGLAALAGLLYLAYYLRHRDEKNWQASLSGVAKLVSEDKYAEAIAALRGATPELNTAFNARTPA